MDSILPDGQGRSGVTDLWRWQPSIMAVRYACFFLLFTCALLVSVGLMFPSGAAIRGLGALCMLVVCATTLFLSSQNNTRNALLVLVAGTWVTVTGLALKTGGIDSVVLVVYPSLVCLAGWLFGLPAAIALSVFTIAWMLFLADAQVFGVLPTQVRTPELLRWLFTSLNLLFSLFVLGYMVRFYTRQLRHVKKLDASLAQSEEMFRSLAEMVPVGIFRADSEGNCIFVNPCYCEISGHNFEEAMGKGWWNAVLAEDLPQVAQGWRLLLAQGTGFSGEYRLIRPDNSVVWVYAQAQRQTGAHGELTGHVCAVTDITANKAAESAIQHLAFYDALTGLPNRRLLMDRLRQAGVGCSRSRSSCALFFLDIDHFKSFNDTMGHDHGDLLLQQVAIRLKESVREGDTVARLGGDEFVLVLENLSQDMQVAVKQAKLVGEKILKRLNQPYELAGIQNHSTPSIGITMFSNAHDSMEVLMKRADVAMYQAKAAGRNTLCFYDSEMQEAMAARVALENELRQGLLENQFLLCYQTQVNAQGRIIGAEAFVRWQHPQRGRVSPATFIPLAEETGLILPLGQWVFDTACRQLAQWSKDPKTAHLTIAVKISAPQFRQHNFVALVIATLEATQARAELLKLELNESLLMADVEEIIEKTTALKDRGLGFSLADLGTGYSSLSHLKRLSLDQLRVDQSFVRGLLTNPNDASVIKSIFALAQSLELEVSAEGVETLEQRDALAAHGCHAYQGYFFSQPLSADEFEKLL